TGIIHIQNEQAKVLFDPGATYSFMSPTFAKKLNKSSQTIECPLVISTPLGETVDVIFMYSVCVVKIEGREFQANLIELPILEFDVILGMDWLSAHQATMDCYRKTIMFKLMGEIEFIFYGDRSDSPGNLISAMVARRLFRKGCQGY